MRAFLIAALLGLAMLPALADPPAAPSPAPTAAASAAASPAPAAAASSVPSGLPSAAPTATPEAEVPALYVRGQVLTISAGYCIFTSGDSVRIASGLVVPKGVRTGSYVRVTLDQLARAIVAIELEPKIDIAGEIDAANIPRQYVVVSPKSAPLPAPTGQSDAASGGPVTVTIVVHVPGNTPASDTVYLSTDRSGYSPYEIAMQRVDGQTFKAAVTLPAGTVLKYNFTRGTEATVERDRTGGIAPPHIVSAAPSVTTSDTVARWADLS